MLGLDFIQGGDLFYHISVNKMFKEDIVRFWAACLVSVLEYLHKQGIIYRDLKPENIMVGGDGFLHLTDLGMCVYAVERGGMTTTVCGYVLERSMDS